MPTRRCSALLLLATALAACAALGAAMPPPGAVYIIRPSSFVDSADHAYLGLGKRSVDYPLRFGRSANDFPLRFGKRAAAVDDYIKRGEYELPLRFG